MGRAVPIHNSQMDRQTDMEVGWAEHALPSLPDRQTAVAHQPTWMRAAQAGSTQASRAGGGPGGARLIPRQTDRQTGPCPAHPAWPRGSPSNPGQARWSTANPRAGTGSGWRRQGWLRQSCGPDQKPLAMVNWLVGKRTQHHPSRFLGEAELDRVPQAEGT